MKIRMLIIAGLLALPLAACDRTVSETSHETRTPNGDVSRETKTVRQDPAGNVTVTHEKSTNEVDNH